MRATGGAPQGLKDGRPFEPACLSSGTYSRDGLRSLVYMIAAALGVQETTSSWDDPGRLPVIPLVNGRTGSTSSSCRSSWQEARTRSRRVRAAIVARFVAGGCDMMITQQDISVCIKEEFG